MPATIEVINGQQIVRDEGKTIRFSGGQYISDDEKEQRLLEASPMYGCDFFDLLKQENQAKQAQEKVKGTLPEIVEGARRTDTQIKGNLPTKLEEVAAPIIPPPPLEIKNEPIAVPKEKKNKGGRPKGSGKKKKK